MNIRIYQVNTDLDEKGVAFAPLDRLERIQGKEEVNAAVYEKVFDGTVSETTLDGVYDLFNEDRPRGFTGRSMSVSDVVQVVDGPVEKGFYFGPWRIYSFAPCVFKRIKHGIKYLNSEM